jgi:hypothetical protein
MSFAAGDRLLAADLNYPATVSSPDVATTDGTTTSTTFVNTLTTTGIRGVAFVAGASGAARVDYQTTGRTSTAGAFTLVEFEIKTGATPGSGSLIRAADDSKASAPQSDSAGQQMQHTGHDLVTGLTPGTTYNATIVYRVTAGTGTFNRRKITVGYAF